MEVRDSPGFQSECGIRGMCSESCYIVKESVISGTALTVSSIFGCKCVGRNL